MDIAENNEIGDLLAYDYCTAGVFEKFGIEFHNHRTTSVTEVCKTNIAYERVLMEDIEKSVASYENESIDVNYWPTVLLIGYVKKRHHRNANRKVPVITGFIDRFCRKNTHQHVEMTRLKEIFRVVSKNLCERMQVEVMLLFSCVKQIVSARQTHTTLHFCDCELVEHFSNAFLQEHRNDHKHFKMLAELLDSFVFPDTATRNTQSTINGLCELTVDLHMHTHLETNILCPRVTEIKTQLKR